MSEKGRGAPGQHIPCCVYSSGNNHKAPSGECLSSNKILAGVISHLASIALVAPLVTPGIVPLLNTRLLVVLNDRRHAVEILLPANKSVCALALLAQVRRLLARVALPARVGFATVALLASTAFRGAALRLPSRLDKRS